ncbi:MAG: transglutaminase family protein [Prosthecobacter sp.]|jgi:transglutaminase-like putative cysteine protease|uniref:transglutaminase family protein n=1 Tax=Prosthecobacter sp. TaxID=1965333 RepID=UPI0019EA8C19|nr:transglutaminase family protein [Prosthecobacter sp.]MBE2282217.1 transglutaminase family protein [Prosthecobacter sp.]
MRFRVFHRTRYVYRAPVRDSYNELRLRPVTDDKSRLEFFLLNVNPPARLRHFRDNWLNYVHYFDIPEPHGDLTIEAQSTINTTNPYADSRPTGVGFPALKTDLDDMVVPFLGGSRYVDISPEVWRLGIDIRDDREDVFETAEAVMHHIFEHWTYAPNTTSVTTHMNEVLNSKNGVCQDFAHLMIGICRSLGIPARYVSGYLYNGPDSHLRGAQASHAWVEVHVPGKGWYGLDPTNDTLADERHIKIATGRDYNDAAPITGHFDGPPGATTALQVELEVRRTDG